MLTKTVIFLTSIGVATAAAADPSKDDWLLLLKDAIPGIICKQLMQKEDASNKPLYGNMTLEQCTKSMPVSFEKCKNQYYPAIPATMDKDSIDKWDKTLGECMGMDFAINYLKTDSNQIAKDAWIDKLKEIGPNLICSNLMNNHEKAKRLKKQGINMEKCLNILPGLINKCSTKYYSSIPAMMNRDSTDKWGESIGTCIGKNLEKE